jgi:hypothetical protein
MRFRREPHQINNGDLRYFDSLEGLICLRKDNCTGSMKTHVSSNLLDRAA